jgi:signal transduction histidine kinase
LASVFDTMALYAGDVRIVSAPGEGTVVRLLLPAFVA